MRHEHLVPTDCQTQYLLRPSVDECLSEKHPARFIVEVIAQLYASATLKSCGYMARALPTNDVALATPTACLFFNCKIERATYDSA